MCERHDWWVWMEIRYVDKTDSFREKNQQGDVVATGETDRVYLNTTDFSRVARPGIAPPLHVTKENSLTTVVWNPWADKANKMSDMGDRRMDADALR